MVERIWQFVGLEFTIRTIGSCINQPQECEVLLRKNVFVLMVPSILFLSAPSDLFRACSLSLSLSLSPLSTLHRGNGEYDESVVASSKNLSCQFHLCLSRVSHFFPRFTIRRALW